MSLRWTATCFQDEQEDRKTLVFTCIFFILTFIAIVSLPPRDESPATRGPCPARLASDHGRPWVMTHNPINPATAPEASRTLNPRIPSMDSMTHSTAFGSKSRQGSSSRLALGLFDAKRHPLEHEKLLNFWGFRVFFGCVGVTASSVGVLGGSAMRWVSVVEVPIGFRLSALKRDSQAAFVARAQHGISPS